MRKTTVYLDDELATRLARIACDEGRSQAAVIRDAIAGYQPRRSDRDFALTGVARRQIANIPEEDLLKGFGE